MQTLFMLLISLAVGFCSFQPVAAEDAPLKRHDCEAVVRQAMKELMPVAEVSEVIEQPEDWLRQDQRAKGYRLFWAEISNGEQIKIDPKEWGTKDPIKILWHSVFYLPRVDEGCADKGEWTIAVIYTYNDSEQLNTKPFALKEVPPQ
jgi:hypothetical protein